MRVHRDSFLLTLVSPVLVLIGTWGAIGKYGFLDDYSILESSISGQFDFEYSLSQGRPFSAVYIFLIFSFIDSINSLIYLHILGSLTLAAFSWLLSIYLKETVQSTFVLISICVAPILLSPGMLLISAWAVLSSTGLPLFSSVLAAFIMRKNQKTFSFLVLLLLLVSFLSYPPATSFFLILPCIAWLISMTRLTSSTNHKELLLTVKRSTINLTLAGLVSLATLKLMTSQFPQTNNRTDLIGDLPTKLEFLTKSALPTAVDFIEPNWGFSYYGWAVIALVLSFYIFRKGSKYLSETLLVMFLSIGTTFGPVALTAENWPSNRSLLASQWLFAILSLIAIFHLMNTFRIPNIRVFSVKVISVILVTLSIYHSNNLLISTMRTPQMKELDLARNALTQVDPTKKIQVKKSMWTDSLSEWLVGDEFGLPSTSQPWVPVPFVKLIMKELYSSSNYQVELVEVITSSNSVDFSKVINPK